ncbi:MAG: hypothetical protein IT294_11580 [Deltaproteobacteria bacterium]|nr:hypothetical protein [Deltaproteobacteria bacterium]
MRIIRALSVTTAILVSGSFAFAAPPIPVTTCGQVVKGSGQLVADLDCSANVGEAVHLTGTLLLNGFVLTGAPTSDVVRCETGACRVVGPGTVTGGADGVRSDGGARVEAGAIITGNTGDGVRTDKTAKVTGATVSANGGDGVRSKKAAVLNGANILDNSGDGVRTDLTATVKASTVSGNGGNGIDSDTIAKAMKGSVVTGNGFDGIRGIRAQLHDSTATGNATDATCGITDECADVASDLFPKVKGTSTCGTSRNPELGGTWGVCSND